MLSLFRTNQAYAGLLLFAYALILWLPLFFLAEPTTVVSTGDGVFGIFLTDWFSSHRYLAVLASVFLVGFQGIQMNTWATRHRLSRTVTQFPGLFLVLVSALVYSFHGFNAFQAANVFLLFGLLSLVRLYKRQEPAVALFNAGAWLGLASLFRPEYLLFFPAFIAGLSILRRIELRGILQISTGIGLVYFFLFVGGYVNGNLGAIVTQQFGSIDWPVLETVGRADQIGLGIIGLLVIGVILGYRNISLMLNIEGSKNISLLCWVLLYTIVVTLFAGTIDAVNAQVLVIPLGALLGLWLVNLQSSRAEVVHMLLAVAAILPLLLPYFQGAAAGG